MNAPDPNNLFEENLHVDQKQCTNCGEWKPHTKTYFETRKSSIPGKSCNLRNTCKECRSKEKKIISKARKSQDPPKIDQPCSICESVESLVLDHDHKTEKFRGWICDNCNKMLGMAGDNPNILAAGIKYLLDHEEKEKLKNSAHEHNH
jgi:hypothetical protein